MLLTTFSDIHTHHSGQPDAILSAPPAVAMALAKENMEQQSYSLQLHPWHINKVLIEEFRQAIDQCKDDPHLVAIGECGLDKHSEVPMEQQQEAFGVAMESARLLQLPVIIHCVNAWAELIAVHRQFTDVPMIVHGFRKGLPLAQQLIHEGIAISLGEKYHPEVAAAIPDELLYFETDESTLNICEIKKNILSLRSK